MAQSSEAILNKIIKENDGLLIREEAYKNGINSTSFSRYLHKNGLKKISSGIYGSDSSTVDELYILQRRYPKIVFSGMSALYLLELTDKIPESIEFTVPKGYRIRKETIQTPIDFHIENNVGLYEIGNTKAQTMFGNEVSCFGVEKQIIEMIRKRKDYDAETFIKAIKTFLARKNKDMGFLLEYAKKRKIEDKVFELLEILTY